MKQSADTDRICIEKIMKYINDIEECFIHFHISTYSDLNNKRLAQLAVAQTITNIHEAKKLIQQSTLDNITEFDKIKLSTARNIASHDYDNVNFEIVYRICNRLLSKQIKGVLMNEYNSL